MRKCALFVVMTTALAAVGRRNRPPDRPHDQLMENCENDVENLCFSETQRFQLLYCLKSHENELSASCSSYLSSTALGGCNDEAENLCGDSRSVEDIFSCLQENKESLGSQCVKNLAMNNQETPWTEAKKRLKSVTISVTHVAFLVLLIPLGGALWCMAKWKELAKMEKTILSDLTSSPGRTAVADVQEISLRAPWCISFSKLSYWDRPGKQDSAKRILSKISGKFCSASVSAVMGPSGSGKTTLLKLLAGRQSSGQLDGIRAVNDEVLPAAVYDVYMRSQGFVAQHDHFAGNLTVWQTLMYAALLRIPENVGVSEKLQRAKNVMRELGLEGVAHSSVNTAATASVRKSATSRTQEVIKNYSKRSLATLMKNSSGGGISGGQRRRLSIAVELLSDPSVLMLDEATSGLDASTSLKLVASLRQLSRRRGTTVALTIHQPRSEVFGLLDDLVLLGPGGFLVYSGKASQAARFLSSAPCITTSLSTYDNPADFILDILDVNEETEESEACEATVVDCEAGIELSEMTGRTRKQITRDKEVTEPEVSVALMSAVAPRPLARGSEADEEAASEIERLNEELQTRLHGRLGASRTSSERQNSSSRQLTLDLKEYFESSGEMDALDKSLRQSFKLRTPTTDEGGVVNAQVGCPEMEPRQLLPMPPVVGKGIRQFIFDSRLKSFPNSFSVQLWILFCRRFQVTRRSMIMLH